MPNNREIALIFWIVVFFIWAILKTDIRNSIKGVFEVFFQREIIIPILILLCYCTLLIWVLAILNIWSISQLTITVFWFFSTALAVFFSIGKIEDECFLKIFAVEQVKIAVFIEFLVNFISFGFWAEVILVPVITFLSLALVVSKHNKEHKKVADLLENIFTIYVLYLIIRTFYLMIINSQDLVVLQTLKDFSVTPLLSLGLLPFIYFLGLYIAYENFFIKVMFSGFDKKIHSLINKQTIIYVNLSRRHLKLWSKEFNLYEMSDLRTIKIALTDFKQKQK